MHSLDKSAQQNGVPEQILVVVPEQIWFGCAALDVEW
jgi:hypothetical protein